MSENLILISYRRSYLVRRETTYEIDVPVAAGRDPRPPGSRAETR